MLEKVNRKLVSKLKTGMTYEDLEEEGFSRYKARQKINELKDRGVSIEERRLENNKKMYIVNEEDREYSLNDNGKKGVVSDTHLGSVAEQLDSLHDFYDRMEDRGINIVFHAGDISDGCNVYRGQENEKKPEAIGWGRLVDYVVKNYPKREDMHTFFIDGNHDNRLYEHEGIRFGKLLDDKRDDLHYLGDGFARINLDDIDIDLVHPSGGIPYTLGYRSQQWLRNKQDDEKADITVFGHLHQLLSGKTEGSQILYGGAWQGQTPYLDKKGINTEAGGWIIDFDTRDGRIIRFNANRYDYPIERVADVDQEDIEKMME